MDFIIIKNNLLECSLQISVLACYVYNCVLVVIGSVSF